MATVYLARDVRHERHVAIKVLKRELADRHRRRPVHRRDSHDRASSTSSHSAAVRFRRCRRTAVLRDAIRRRRIVTQPPARARRAADRGSGADSSRSGGCAGARARVGHHPPRRQARQRPDVWRSRVPGGLRRGSRGRRARRPGSDRDRHGPDGGHARLHGAGAGDRRRHRSPNRRVRIRRDGVRAAGWRAAIHRHPSGHRDCPVDRGACAVDHAPPRHARTARERDHAMPAEEAGRAMAADR